MITEIIVYSDFLMFLFHFFSLFLENQKKRPGQRAAKSAANQMICNTAYEDMFCMKFNKVSDFKDYLCKFLVFKTFGRLLCSYNLYLFLLNKYEI